MTDLYHLESLIQEILKEYLSTDHITQYLIYSIITNVVLWNTKPDS